MIIFAGAGTGKTKVITHRMAYLISQGVEPPTILAVTFTKKATREMQERVNKLIPAVSNKHKPLIATFHSFCAKFLRTNLIPVGMKPFGIANKSKETEIIKQCISQLNIDTEFHKPSKIMNNISLAKG